ncbi:MAG: glycosyltransferase family 39 protein [Jatrophihabitantaceae bacterium]
MAAAAADAGLVGGAVPVDDVLAGRADGRLGRTAWLAAGSVTLALVALAGRYGFHRDELYFLIAGRHLAFGYVDQPPFTLFVARAQELVFGGSPLAVRVWPALVAGAVVLFAAVLCRELGGGRRARALVAVGIATSPGVLLAGHTLSTETTDVLVWQVLVLLVVRALRTGRLRLWLAVGAVVGVGLQNKDLPGFLALALLIGLLITRRREVLTNRYLWLGALLAVAIAAPAIAWQAIHGFPQWQVAQAQRHGTGPVKYVLEQLLILNPALLPAIVRGTRALWRTDRYRTLVWTFALLEVFFLATGGKAYYPAPMLILLAVAGVAAKQTVAPAGGAARHSGRWPMLMRYGSIAAFGALLLPAVLPVLPESVFAASPYAGQDDARATIGWPQLAQQVDAVIARAGMDRAGTVILTDSYGEAGALERFSDSGLRVYSGHNSLWYYGRPADDAGQVVTVGYDLHTLVAWFATCRVAAYAHTPYGLDNQEDGAPIAICTRPRAPWTQLWPHVRHNN